MSLIKCEECGNDISEHAKQCQYCGYPLDKQDNIIAEKKESETIQEAIKKHHKKFIIVAVIVVIIILSIVIYNHYRTQAIAEALSDVSINVENNLPSIDVNRINNIVELFSNGSTGIIDFCSKVEEYSTDMDYSPYKAPAEILDANVRQALISTSNGIADAYQVVQEQFESGDLSIYEYIDCLSALRGVVICYSCDLNEAIDVTHDNILSEATANITNGLNDNLETSLIVDAYSYFAKTMQDNYDYLSNHLDSEGMYSPPNEITNEYTDFINDLVTSLYRMDAKIEANGGAPNYMLNQIELIIPNVSGWDEVKEAMASSPEVGADVVQWLLNDMKSKLSEELSALAPILRNIATILTAIEI